MQSVVIRGEIGSYNQTRPRMPPKRSVVIRGEIGSYNSFSM